MLDWEVIVFLEMFVGPSHDFGQVTHRTCVYFDPQFCHAHSESYWCFRNHYSLPKMFLVCFGSSPAPDWRCAHIQDRNQMLVIHFICHTCLPSCWCCSSRDSVGRVVICSPSIWNKNYDYAGSNNNATDHDGSNINMIQQSNYSVWMARGALTLCISCAHRGSLAPVGGHMGPQDCSQHL